MFQASILRALAAFSIVAAAASSLLAGNNNFRNNAVGGVAISPEGVLSKPTVAALEGLRRQLNQAVKPVPDGLQRPVELRKISLRGLEEAFADALKNNFGVLPDELKYLAGIQRIEYVLIYPEQHDIVLAGPGEGWTVNEFGAVVGKSTGRPVIDLEDLLVALRTVDDARRGGISCSIDPTPEGRRALETFMSKQKKFSPSVLAGIENALGPQRVTVTGVPETSHFARVMVASDFRMKMIAMNLAESPIAGLPSYLDMIRTARSARSNMMPRWWLAGNYEPLARSEDGLAWQLRGPGIQVLTEDDFIAADGSVQDTGQKSVLAQRWAAQMTSAYDELSKKEATFGQLRNAMDMCVVAALIAKEDLLTRAGCQLPLLTSSESPMMLESWNPARTVATQCSFLKRGTDYIITASGGVQIESWKFASKSQIDPQPQQTRQKASNDSRTNWWWN